MLSKLSSRTILNAVKQSVLAFKGLDINTPFYRRGKFNFSQLTQITQPKKKYYFYYGWLKEQSNIKLFEAQIQAILKDLNVQKNGKQDVPGVPNDKLENFVKRLLSAEKQFDLKNSKQFKKWQTRRQLHKAVMLNVRYQLDDINLSQVKNKMFLQLRIIETFQKAIAEMTVDYICGLPTIQKMIIDNFQGRNFLNEKSYIEQILPRIDSTFQNLWKKQFGERPVSQEVKEYVVGGFRCLFDLTMENYNEAKIGQVQQRYCQGMINGQMAFFVTPVTAQVFKFLFKSAHRIDALSATKRIGKSHAVLLARILYSYYANSQKRHLFFENLMVFEDIKFTNTLLVNMIRNCLYDTLKREDFSILNSDYFNENRGKNLPPIQQQAEQKFKKRQLDKSSQKSYTEIKLIEDNDVKQTDFSFKESGQAQIKVTEEKAEFANISFSYQQNQIIHLIHFQELLNLIQLRRGTTSVIVVDQFNYVGRLLYEIIALKNNYKQESQNKIRQKLRQLVLIKSLINAGSNLNIRCLASMHNFVFEKLLNLIDRNLRSQSDGYKLFGYSLSGQEAKFQLQWELKKKFSKLEADQKLRFKDFYQRLLSKEFINEVIIQLDMPISSSNILILSQKLMDFKEFIKQGKDLKLIIQNLKDASIGKAREQQIGNLQVSFEKFNIQSISKNTEDFKTRILLNATKRFQKHHHQKFSLKDFHLSKAGNSMGEQYKASSCNNYFHYITTFLSFFKFYHKYEKKNDLVQFLSPKYYDIWILFNQSFKTFYLSSLLIKIKKTREDLFNKQNLSSVLSQIGIKLQGQIWDFLVTQHNLRAQTNLAGKKFPIHKYKLLKNQLNKKKHLKQLIQDFLMQNIKQNGKLDNYCMIFKCFTNQAAHDFLIINSQINGQVFTLYLNFGQIGVNKQYLQAIKKMKEQLQKLFIDQIQNQILEKKEIKTYLEETQLKLKIQTSFIVLSGQGQEGQNYNEQNILKDQSEDNEVKLFFKARYMTLQQFIVQNDIPPKTQISGTDTFLRLKNWWKKNEKNKKRQND